MTNWLDPELLAQEVHGAIGFGFLLAVWYRVRPYGFDWFALALAVLLVVVFIKEIAWDPFHEEDQPFWPQGAEDLAFYVVGIAAGLAFVLL